MYPFVIFMGFLLVIPLAVLVAHRRTVIRAREIDPVIRAAAESVGGWPVGYVRSRPSEYLAVSHGNAGESDPALIRIAAGVVSVVPLTDAVELAKNREIVWYGLGTARLGEQPLGLRQLGWLVDGDAEASQAAYQEEKGFMRWWAIIGLALFVPLIVLVAVAMVVQLMNWPR